MASFNPSKKTAIDFNSGVKYVDYDQDAGINGDGVQADTINNLIEGALYAQERAESAESASKQAQSSAENANNAVTALGNSFTSFVATIEEKNSEQDTAISNAQSAANGKYTKPDGGIPANDLAGDIPISKIMGLGSLASKSAITSADITNGTITNDDISSTARISASKISGLAAVSTSGAYEDLSGAPTFSLDGTTLTITIP